MEYFDVLNEFGEYTNEVISRDECHKKGLWHKAVVAFIVSEDNQKILLQKRSSTKKLWPNLWDITAGGHVHTLELGTDAVIREIKEELGLNISKSSLEFIGATTSINNKDDIINKHYNEYYIIHADIDIKDIVLDPKEVEDIKWFSKNELIERINNNYDGLTNKIGCWNYLIKYFEIKEK